MAVHWDMWKICAAWLLMGSCLLSCRGAPNNSTTRMPTDFPLPAIRLEIGHHEPRYDHRMLAEGSEVAPLFQGRGIHYSFIWVGSPPQRVSVIMDTGSHHTAFPCVGCKCGKHMNPFFDPAKSSSSSVKSCGIIQSSSKCFFRQSYSEGSSWHAYKVSDRVFVGGETLSDIPGGVNYTVDFEFGCQDYESGLFRTQYVDGIMGLSASEETLPFQLFNNKVITTRMFALCFRLGGGLLTIGGVDPSLHRYASVAHDHESTVSIVQSQVLFAKLLRPKGWYTVSLMDILMINPADKSIKSIGGAIYKSIGGKGTIVDSGTTDTYLPSALASNFKALFTAITKIPYDNKVIKLDPKRYNQLPIIVYRLESVEAGKTVDIKVYPHSYMEKHSADSYTPRVYLTESSGAVLGANFINNYNTIFDIDNMRVGFARSDCVPGS